MAFLATTEYMEGKPVWGAENFFRNNSFILGHRHMARATSNQWMQQYVPDANQVLKINSAMAILNAVKQHIGIGCLPSFLAKHEPQSSWEKIP